MKEQKSEIIYKPQDISGLAKRIDWQGDTALLLQAVTHPTFFEGVKSEENKDNQRLEFLGDAVLGFLVGEALYRKHEQADEGILSKSRAAMVCEGGLAEIAKKIDLSDYLRMGKGSLRRGEQYRDSVVSDAFEAVMAALYLQHGIEHVRKLVNELFTDRFENLSTDRFEDYKGLMQQLVQSIGDEGLQYKMIDATGPDHDKVYTIALYYAGQKLSEASGSSKKEAELKAARIAWEKREHWLKK